MSDDARAISVVIPCFADERFEDVLDCVVALRRQTLPPAEIVVVVDHNPALLERLRAAVPAVRAVANREPRGSSGARNTGIACTHRDIVAFFDDDAAPEPAWSGWPPTMSTTVSSASAATSPLTGTADGRGGSRWNSIGS
jgi:GT2 family glycosyltransferase